MKNESLNNPSVIICIIGPINRIMFSRMKYVQVTKKYYKIKRKKRKKVSNCEIFKSFILLPYLLYIYCPFFKTVFWRFSLFM